jgi:hypothetical protein
MILIQGKILPNREQESIIQNLYPSLITTLKKPPLSVNKVIEACDKLEQKIKAGAFDDLVSSLLEQFQIPRDLYERNLALFSKEGLESKVLQELGPLAFQPDDLDANNRRQIAPLGVLLHVAAGNVDGLPAYSVVEGLLTGNINILKLPSGDSGLSIKILSELIAIEPDLAEYIYVFDIPSTEIDTIKMLASYCDGVVVWGGDAANKAAREFCDIHTKIISWGHKISFSYVTKDVSDQELTALSESVCRSNQLLCSSSQGIFLDTESEEEQLTLAKRFFDILVATNDKMEKAPLGMRAKNAISLYNEILERKGNDAGVFSKGGVSVICYPDSELTLSYLFRNVWIKRLPRNKIIEMLKPKKNLLQSVGIGCQDSDRPILSSLFIRAGLVRIVGLGETERLLAKEAHDGVYALREYSRIVETKK